MEDYLAFKRTLWLQPHLLDQTVEITVLRRTNGELHYCPEMLGGCTGTGFREVIIIKVGAGTGVDH